jgi:hypothetical protein
MRRILAEPTFIDAKTDTNIVGTSKTQGPTRRKTKMSSQRLLCVFASLRIQSILKPDRIFTQRQCS